jgi:ribosome-associated protein
MNDETLMESALEALLARKGRNPCVIDISKVTTIARYFVIVSGTSTTHIKALADSVEDVLGRLGRNPYRRTGYGSARWILLDFSEVVVHIFHDDERTFYGLERLWQDGEFLLPHEMGERFLENSRTS